ncbi:MAG: hypothetical protein EBX92_05490 [Actinobacteria bacterium]|nr:hypothetical protein [Actinomycetota bacterium]
MRTLHPFAWWAWGISLAIAASQVRSIWLTVIIILASLVVAFARKTQDPWAAALIIGMKIALVALTLRMVIAVLFSVPGQGTVLFSIPRIQLPEWLAGIFLGGAVTVERLRFVLFESLTIFALVITVAAASSLANPKQTLRSLPGVLHEADKTHGRSSVTPTVVLLVGVGSLFVATIQLVTGDDYRIFLLVSLIFIFIGLFLGNRQSTRTRYRPIPWQSRESLVLLTSILAIILSRAPLGPMLTVALIMVMLAPLFVTSRPVAAR